MATQEEQWSCPICQDATDDVAYITPCLHKFCLGCVLRWAKENTSCALCRQRVSSIRFSVRSQEDFLEVYPVPSDPLEEHDDDLQEQGNVEPAGSRNVAGFPPEAWAAFFRESRDMLEPLLPWLRQWLRSEAGWWETDLRQILIITLLCHHGLDESVLVQVLQRLLREQTVPFVRELIQAAVERCSEQMHWYMDQRGADAAEEQEHSPAAIAGPALSPGGTPTSSPEQTPCSLRGGTPTPSPQGTPAPSLEGTSTPSPQTTPTPSPGVRPIPDTSAQEDPSEELGQLVAGPSTAAQDRVSSPGSPPTSSSRRPPKRRASGSLDDSSEPKRPHHRPTPNPTAQEPPLEELGQLVAGPSTAPQDRDSRDSSPRRSPTSSPRRPPKRRASGSPDNASDPKRPHRQQD